MLKKVLTKLATYAVPTQAATEGADRIVVDTTAASYVEMQSNLVDLQLTLEPRVEAYQRIARVDWDQAEQMRQADPLLADYLQMTRQRLTSPVGT